MKTLLIVLTVAILLFQQQYALPEPLMMALAGGGLMGFAAFVRRFLAGHVRHEQALERQDLLAEASRQLAGRSSRARQRAMHA